MAGSSSEEEQRRKDDERRQQEEKDKQKDKENQDKTPEQFQLEYFQMLTEMMVNGPKVAPPKPSSFQLGVDWLLGLGERTVSYKPGDQFTEELRKDHSMDVVRARIRERIAGGDDSGKDGYSVLGQEGVPRLLSDALDVQTFGVSGWLDAKTSGGKYSSSTSVFVGSYDYSYKVLSRDAQRGTAEVEIKIKNDTTFNSLVHPPIFREQWDSYIGGRSTSSLTGWAARFRPGPRPPRGPKF